MTMTFVKQAQELISDPAVYRLFDAVAAKVDGIVELMEEKRRSAMTILKDYTDGLMETVEGQMKPPADEFLDSSSECTTHDRDSEEEKKKTAEKLAGSSQLDCNLFTTTSTD